MTGRWRHLRLAAIGAVSASALIAIPAASPMRAEGQADALCREVGGLHVREDIPADAIFAEVPTVLFAQSDPLLEIARGRLFDDKPVRAWQGQLQEATVPCLQSGECASVLLTRSRRAYLHTAPDGGRYLISVLPSSLCDQAHPIGHVPGELDAAASHYATLLGRRPQVCRASPSASSRLYIVSQQALSDGSGGLQFRAWRVFREGRAEPVIAYNQFGVRGGAAQVESAAAAAAGVPAQDYSNNRCRVDTHARPYLPHNADSHFDLDRTYPQGRFVDGGTEP